MIPLPVAPPEVETPAPASPSTSWVEALTHRRLMGMLLLYRVAVDLWYVLVVPGLFGRYPALVWSPWRILESVGMVLLVSRSAQVRWRVPSAFYHFLLVVAVFIPMTTLYAYSVQPRGYMYVVLASVVTIGWATRIAVLRVPGVIALGRLVIPWAVGLTVIVFAWLFLSTGGRLTFNLTELYEVRIQSRDTVFRGLWGYVIEWVAKVCVPFLMAWALLQTRRARLWWVIAVSALAVLLFGLTTHKFFVLSGIAPAVIFWVWRTPQPPLTVLRLSLALFGAFAVWYLATGNPWVPAIAIQRPIFKPAFLNFVYVEFFHGKPLVYMSTGLVGNFVQYPFDLSPSFLVGEYLKGSLDTRSNTGFLGTGYAHFGILGPWLLAVAVAGVLKTLDAVTGRLPIWFVVAATFGPISSMLISTDFLPALNTNGVILSLLVVWAFRTQFEYDETGTSSAHLSEAEP